VHGYEQDIAVAIRRRWGNKLTQTGVRKKQH